MNNNNNNGIYIPVGGGELIDKITILQIKAERIEDVAKLSHVHDELAKLEKISASSLSSSQTLTDLFDELKAINIALWDIENDIRACESAEDFGPQFIKLARAVYITNDKRAGVKKQINLLTGAAVMEEKSYTEF